MRQAPAGLSRSGTYAPGDVDGSCTSRWHPHDVMSGASAGPARHRLHRFGSAPVTSGFGAPILLLAFILRRLRGADPLEEDAMDKMRAAEPPAGYHSVTPFLAVKDIAEAIDFYKKAFGAVERIRMQLPESKHVVHGEVAIGDSIVMLGNESEDYSCLAPATLKATTGALYVYVRDVDAAFRRAVESGCRATMPVADMFWGDRVGEVQDLSGHRWNLATHKEDLSIEEMLRRGQAWFASKGHHSRPGSEKTTF